MSLIKWWIALQREDGYVSMSYNIITLIFMHEISDASFIDTLQLYSFKKYVTNNSELTLYAKIVPVLWSVTKELSD